jgi:hypothetical protein
MKDALVAGLAEARQNILDAASALPARARNEVFLGSWSIKDLLAHLIGWDFANIDAVKAILAGKVPGFYAYHDRDWQTYNARLVTEYKQNNFARLVAAMKASHRELIALLGSVSAEEFDKDRGLRVRGYKVTIARIMQAEMSDEKVHQRQIEEFAEKRA